MAGPARRVLPMLSVADLRASLAFYGDLLGGEPTYRFPEDDPVFVAVRLGESSTTSTRRSARPARLAPRWCWSPPTSRGASGSPTSPTRTATW